jgi:hypothetical protein
MIMIITAPNNQYESLYIATYEYSILEVSKGQGPGPKLTRHTVSRAPSCNFKGDPLRQTAANLIIGSGVPSHNLKLSLFVVARYRSVSVSA